MVIYKITNKVNGKIYIGKWQGKTAISRWKSHLKAAASGRGFYLHRAIRKYGADNFTFEVIATVQSKSELESLEREFIASYRSIDPTIGYNLAQGGHSGKTYPGERNPFFGKTHTPEVKQRLADAARLLHTGRKRSMRTRQAISTSLKQHKRTEEHCRHISEAKKGKPGRVISEEEKTRLRELKKQWWAARRTQC